MSRIYYVPFSAVAITAPQDLFDLVPAADKPIKLVAMMWDQVTRHGDAQEEMLRWSIHRGLATVGSGGSSVTPSRGDPGDAAASFTARVNDTTQAVVGGGTDTILHRGTFNVRIPFVMIATPEMKWKCSATETRLVISLDTAPSTSMTYSGTAVVQEGID